MYEIPESMKAVELFYNKTIFATAPVTTADWMANASKLGWVYGANGGGAYYLWGLFSSFGGKILADDGKCAATATTGVADALKWLSGHEGGRHEGLPERHRRQGRLHRRQDRRVHRRPVAVR